MKNILNHIQYNSILILSFFFVSLIIFILNTITKNKLNNLLFSSQRGSLLNPLTYIKLVTHSLGHENWQHFSSNFLYILLIGPMIEEKYGSMKLLCMIIVTSVIISIINFIIGKNKILGASGIVFMMIVLSSFVNIVAGKIPLTLILIFIFYIVNEFFAGAFKNDKVSHLGHIIGALCGVAFGFYFK